MAAPTPQTPSRNGSTGTSVTVTLPPSSVASDTLSILAHSDTSATSGGATFGAPSGAVSSGAAITSNPGAAGNSAQHFTKVLTSADISAGSLTFTRSGGTGAWGVIMDRMLGTCELDAYGPNPATGTDGVSPSVTTTGSDRLAWFYNTWDEGKTLTAVPSGSTQSGTTNTLSSNAAASAYQVFANAGATPAAAWDLSAVTRTCCITVAYKPAAAGGTDGTAAGATVSSTASIATDGAAGEQNAEAPGTILVASSSMLAGAADGQVSATVDGAVLSAQTTIVEGAAAGESNGEVPGAEITATATVLAGAASADGSGSAVGATWVATGSLQPGSGQGEANGSAQGAAIEAVATLISGTWSVSVIAGGAVLDAVASLTAGNADGVRNDLAAGTLLVTTTDLLPGAASGIRDDLRGPTIWRGFGAPQAVRSNNASGYRRNLAAPSIRRN